MSNARAQSERSPPSRLALYLASLGLMLAVFLSLLEIVGRVIDPFGVSYYPETARYMDTLIVEEPIGYRNRPGLSGRFWDTQVSINSLGLRGGEIAPKPEEDEVRILMLGDSVTFGLGVADADSIPRQLERQLNRAHDDRTYRVINMGVPSYNTEQELEQLQSLGLQLDPDLVLLIFSLNDLQPKMWVFDRRDSWLVDMAQRSYALSLLAVFYWETRKLLTGHDSRATYGSDIEIHPGWPKVKSALSRIKALCEERDVPFVLFLQASYPEIEAFAGESGIPVVILDRIDRNLTVSITNPHPNRAGAERFATQIHDGLDQLGLN